MCVHAVLRVISSHRGSLSPDDIDSLLAVEATTSPVSRKTSNEETDGGLLRDTTSDLKLLPVSPSLPQKSLSKGGGIDKARDSSSMLARRSSHTFAAALRGGHRDRATIEDVETTDSFELHTTLVPSDNGKVTGDQGCGDIHVSKLRDTDWSSQGSPIDNVGVSSSSHIYHQQATPPGPGPLHMAAKYAQN